MQLICPECMGALESADGRHARCTVHGGRYAILFARQPMVAPPRPPREPSVFAYSLVPGTACAQHPSTPADYACSECGTPICGVCSFDEAGDIHLCPSCAQRNAASGPPAAVVLAAPPPLPIAAGVHCVQHPQTAATARCKICGSFMCNTCKFELPGGMYVCPPCAMNPQTAAMSSKKKLLLAGSFIAAICSTLLLGATFAGVFRQMVDNKEEEKAVMSLIFLFQLVSAITGVSLGAACMRRRQGTPIAVWIAVVWNSAFLGLLFLFMIIGMLMR